MEIHFDEFCLSIRDRWPNAALSAEGNTSKNSE
jgi:hypothetical protein